MGYNVLPLTRLVEQFERLPGIGRKSAQRLAFYLLNQPPERGRNISRALLEARRTIRRCGVCQNLTDAELCPICQDAGRDRTVICTVEDPRDVIAFERTRNTKDFTCAPRVISPWTASARAALYQGASRKAFIGRGQRGDHGTESHRRGGGHRHVSGAPDQTHGHQGHPPGLRIPVGGSLEFADDVTLYRALEGRNEL